MAAARRARAVRAKCKETEALRTESAGRACGHANDDARRRAGGEEMRSYHESSASARGSCLHALAGNFGCLGGWVRQVEIIEWIIYCRMEVACGGDLIRRSRCKAPQHLYRRECLATAAPQAPQPHRKASTSKLSKLSCLTSLGSEPAPQNATFQTHGPSTRQAGRKRLRRCSASCSG